MYAFTGKEDGTPGSSTWQRTLKRGFDRRFGPAESAASLRLNCPYSAPVPKTLAVFIFILAKHLSRRRNQQVNPSTDNAHDDFIGAIRGFFRRVALHAQASFGAAIREGRRHGHNATRQPWLHSSWTSEAKVSHPNSVPIWHLPAQKLRNAQVVLDLPRRLFIVPHPKGRWLNLRLRGWPLRG
jgi:hypothetical protein